MSQQIDTTFLAAADFQRRLAQLDGRDGLEQEAREQIIEAILADKSLDCGGYEADADDFATVVSERPDFTAKLQALVCGSITPDAFKVWADKALEDYADRHASDRADSLECREQDAADYYGSDR